MKCPKWVWYVLAVVALFVLSSTLTGGISSSLCQGTYVYCPGVGCVSGPDKCFPGSKGGASAVFSKEGFVSKSCPGGTRSDGPCLMDFPDQ
jgi:hypothetical protein